MLDLALHPQFERNRLLYFSYSARSGLWGELGTEVARAELIDDRDGLIYLSLGDRCDNELAQDMGDHNGSIIRAG